MSNRLTAEPQQDGTEIWTNRDEETAEEIRYVFVPKADLRPSDRVEDMVTFRPRANGRGLEKVTEPGRGNLSASEINAMPAGSFVRMREAPPRPAPNGEKPGRSRER